MLIAFLMYILVPIGLLCEYLIGTCLGFALNISFSSVIEFHANAFFLMKCSLGFTFFLFWWLIMWVASLLYELKKNMVLSMWKSCLLSKESDFDSFFYIPWLILILNHRIRLWRHPHTVSCTTDHHSFHVFPFSTFICMSRSQPCFGTVGFRLYYRSSLPNLSLCEIYREIHDKLTYENSCRL